MTRRILIIDDDPDILDVAELSLAAFGGFDVITASSGEEAVALAEQHSPDAILLDARMTPMDGLAVLERLRRSAKTSAIPAIFVTASVEFSERQALDRLAVRGVIEKPFDPETLAERVSAMLGWA